MEQTILIWFCQNIWQHLWRWSTLDCPTAGMTEMTLSIWHNCCPRYCSSVPSAYKQLPKHTVAWVWGLYNSNVLFHWVCGISKISNKILFWMEPTVKLDVFGIHLLCLGLTRGFNKNNLKNIPLKALYILCLCSTRLHPKYNVSRAVIKIEAWAWDFLWLP